MADLGFASPRDIPPGEDGAGAVDSTGSRDAPPWPHPAGDAGRQARGGTMTARQQVERHRRMVFLIIVGLILLLLLG